MFSRAFISIMYFYHNSCGVSFEFWNVIKVRCDGMQGLSQLGVVVLFCRKRTNI